MGAGNVAETGVAEKDLIARQAVRVNTVRQEAAEDRLARLEDKITEMRRIRETVSQMTAARPAIPPIAPFVPGSMGTKSPPSSVWTHAKPANVSTAPAVAQPVRRPPEAAPKPATVSAASAARAAANTSTAMPKDAAPKPAAVPVPMADVKRWKKSRMPKLKIPAWQKSIKDVGVIATGAWLAGATLYLGGVVGWENLLNLPAHQLGSVIAGIAAPLALIWMGINYARRHQDIQEQIAPLIAQIDQLVNPNKQVEARIDAVTDGLRRQANELINAAHQVEKTLGKVRGDLRGDMEKLLEYAGLTGTHLEQASLSMANRTSQLARMTEQMHGRLVSFEEHAKSGSDRLDQSVTDMMTKAQGASDKLERQTNNVIAALHAANMRMQRTADDLDSRIGQIADFADKTAARFGDVAVEFGKQSAVVDAAAGAMQSQLGRTQGSFDQQLLDMNEAIRAFAALGADMAGAVTDFRGTAEQVVGAAMHQIRHYTEAMDTRLQQAQSALDRTASAALSKVGNLDRNVAAQLQAMQATLADAAAETPQVVKTILDETTRQLLAMDMRFTGAGAQVTERLAQIERGISGRLESMGQLADRMGEDANDGLRNAMVGVFTEMHDLKDQFSERASNAQGDLRAFHSELAQTIEALAHVARRSTDRTVERIMSVNAGIGQRIMDLQNTAEAAHSEGQALETRLAQHIGMLRGTSDQMGQYMSRIEERGASMVSDLQDASGTAMAQTEIMSHVIGRDADALRTAAMDAAAALGQAGNALGATNSELYASLARSVAQLNDVMRDVETQRMMLEQSQQGTAGTHASLYHEIVQLRDLTADLNSQMGDTLGETDARAKDLRSLTTRLGEVTLGIKAALTASQRDLDRTADKIVEMGASAREEMQTHSQQLVQVAAQVTHNSQQLTGALKRQQSALDYSVTAGTAAVGDLMQKLDDSVATVAMAAETAARDLDWFTASVTAAGTTVDAIGTRAHDAIGRAREALVLSEASLQRTASSARVNLSELSERYTAEGDRMTGVSGQVYQSYDVAIKRLENLGHALAGQSFQTFDTLSEMGVLFDARIAQLRMGSAESSDELNRAAAELERNYAALTAGTEAAARQLQDIQTALTSTQTDVSLTTNHATGRVEAVRRELGVYAQDLMMMVAQATGQMEAAATGFGQKADGMRTAANENAGQIGAANQQVMAGIDQLMRTVQEATAPGSGKLTAAVQQLRQQTEQLVRASVQSLQELEQQGVRSVQQIGQLSQSAEHVARSFGEKATVFEAQTRGITAVGEQLNHDVEKAARQISAQTQVLQAAAERGVATMADAGRKLAAQTTDWDRAGTAAQSKIQGLITTVAGQISELDSVFVKATEASKQLSASEGRVRRDAFLNAAKFIIESLNSLSIDLTRVLDPQEADRVWKEFSKGDAAAFTRRFLEMRETVPAQRLREKYERDNEFRTYVARYFRQFEELFEQALTNDSNDLLATMLTTSDVGKLYTYLAGALGHSKLRVVRTAAA